jgi:hypothetical protein
MSRERERKYIQSDQPAWNPGGAPATPRSRKNPVFDCAVAICTMQNALLVISNLTWLDYTIVEKSSQVKLLITKNAFWIEQRATAHSKTGINRGYGLVEALAFFKPAGLTVCIFSLSFFVSFTCSSGMSEFVSVLIRVQCRIRAQRRCLFGSWLKQQAL